MGDGFVCMLMSGCNDDDDGRMFPVLDETENIVTPPSALPQPIDVDEEGTGDSPTEPVCFRLGAGGLSTMAFVAPSLEIGGVAACSVVCRGGDGGTIIPGSPLSLVVVVSLWRIVAASTDGGRRELAQHVLLYHPDAGAAETDQGQILANQDPRAVQGTGTPLITWCCARCPGLCGGCRCSFAVCRC